jgi:hypothetical protein
MRAFESRVLLKARFKTYFHDDNLNKTDRVFLPYGALNSYPVYTTRVNTYYYRVRRWCVGNNNNIICVIRTNVVVRIIPSLPRPTLSYADRQLSSTNTTTRPDVQLAIRAQDKRSTTCGKKEIKNASMNSDFTQWNAM